MNEHECGSLKNMNNTMVRKNIDWYLIFEDWDYRLIRIRINYCPYCGEDLEVSHD